MSLRALYYMAQEYLLIGGILAVVSITTFLVIRHFHAKRNGKEHRKINIKRLLWWLVFLCYIFVVVGATMLSRGSNYEYDTITPLFYSYKNAWNNWYETEWRNIILNICMFVPFGLLLPMGLKWFQKFYRTYAAGFLFSLFIELSQMIFKIGIFEPDDLMDNTLGAMIGFGLYIVLFKLYAKEKANLRKGATFASNIPLILAVAIFMAIYVVYSCKELGNNNNRYIRQYDTDKLNIHGVSFDDDTKKVLPVYRMDKETIYKEYEVISEAEAYKRLTEGKFKRFGNDYLDIEVLSCEITYSMDTKHFYQPNYKFVVNINGKEAWIIIPALEAAQEY